jgi:hypothetical protein
VELTKEEGVRLRINRDAFDALQQCAVELGVRLSDDYRGRNAYGDTCVVLHAPGLTGLVNFTVAVVNAAHDAHANSEWPIATALGRVISFMTTAGTREDGVGRDQVYFWPGLHVEGVKERG